MRGDERRQVEIFSCVTLEQRVPGDHRLREIRRLTDVVLRSLSVEFDQLYSAFGRPRDGDAASPLRAALGQLPPEPLHSACSLQVFQLKLQLLDLAQYIAAAGIVEDRKGPLFRTTRGRSGELTGNSLLQSDVWRMIRRRALAAGIKTEIGCHTFRATGITAYLKNGGRLEIAQQMAAHESARTTGLYDRRSDEVSLDEVERIGI